MDTPEPFLPPGHEYGLVTDIPMTATMVHLMGVGATWGSVTLSHGQIKALEKVYGFSPEKDMENMRANLHDVYVREHAAWEAQMEFLRTDPRGYRQKYGFNNQPPAEPLPAKEAILQGGVDFLRAGAMRNLMRYAERDGLRLMAFLSRYMEAGEDPVKLAAHLCIEAGYDVPDVSEWLEEDDPDA